MLFAPEAATEGLDSLTSMLLAPVWKGRLLVFWFPLEGLYSSRSPSAEFAPLSSLGDSFRRSLGRLDSRDDWRERLDTPWWSRLGDLRAASGERSLLWSLALTLSIGERERSLLSGLSLNRSKGDCSRGLYTCLGGDRSRLEVVSDLGKTSRLLRPGLGERRLLSGAPESRRLGFPAVRVSECLRSGVRLRGGDGLPRVLSDLDDGPGSTLDGLRDASRLDFL